jgi:hypothetical protein
MKSRRIKACPRCGSLEVRAPSLREGGIPGSSEIAGVYFCKKCKKKIMPIIFDSENAYRKFLKGK